MRIIESLSGATTRLRSWFRSKRLLNTRYAKSRVVARRLQNRLNTELAIREALQAELDDFKHQLNIAENRADKIEAELDVARSQLELVADWQQYWQARMQAEASIQAARKTRALNGQYDGTPEEQ